MSLRTKLLALSLLTLLLPWSAWMLLQELEGYLRGSHEETLLASARTLAGALPDEFRERLGALPADYLPVRSLQRHPSLDGYGDDWPGQEPGRWLPSVNGGPGLRVMAGEYSGKLFLLIDVPVQESTAVAVMVRLLVRSPRGLFRYTIEPAAPGPLQLSDERGASGQAQGFWLDHGEGFRLELALPLAVSNSEIAVRADRAEKPAAGRSVRAQWLPLLPAWRAASNWLSRPGVAATRSWLVDADGWVLAGSRGPADAAEPGTAQTTWLQRSIYALVAGNEAEPVAGDWPVDPVRFEPTLMETMQSGGEASQWARDPDTAAVWNTVAVPVTVDGAVRGAIVKRSTSEGLLLMTNRALARLLLTTLALALLLAVGLWLYATRLSRRVRRLGSAVSEAMDRRVDPATLPLLRDGDELGELARNNERLLRAVTEYGQYLQTLASKLSHELKTPLAITRSSLDNLATHELDPETRRYIERAREGIDRQSAIVRAMSEASRLEASIEGAEWSRVDLADFVRGCTDGYRDLYGGRRLEVFLPDRPVSLRCAPDLLAQALDKLVDNAMSLSGTEDRVSVLLEAVDGHVDLAVRNTGTRLPDELQDRLFDSLVSLRARRGESPHLGLGLYIVRLVSAAHGGDVSARNLPGEQGVEFRINLPVPRTAKGISTGQ